MSRGQFSEIEVKTHDEIGSLCTVFNEMGRQIQNDFDEFERAERAQREFVANVSHELKTPLTVIKSYSQTLRAMEVDRDTQKRFLVNRGQRSRPHGRHCRSAAVSVKIGTAVRRARGDRSV